jgi:hypothetical protein
MCFGNDSPERPPQLALKPDKEEIMDVFDEVNGVQSVIVTGPDGKKRRINSRMPRTPEEEQRFKMAEDLISTSMQNIIQLYKYNPQSVVDYAPLIETFANLDRKRIESLSRITNLGNIAEEVNTFKQMQSSLIDEQFKIRERDNEEHLAHSGRGSSTLCNCIAGSNGKGAWFSSHGR